MSGALIHAMHDCELPVSRDHNSPPAFSWFLDLTVVIIVKGVEINSSHRQTESMHGLELEDASSVV